MAEKKEKHVHKLKRYRFKSGNTVYFCSLPDCHFKIAIPLAIGKRTICWRCGKDFIMNEYTIRLAKPHCESCHKNKTDEAPHIEEPTPAVETMSLSERLNKALVFGKPVEESLEQEDDI